MMNTPSTTCNSQANLEDRLASLESCLAGVCQDMAHLRSLLPPSAQAEFDRVSTTVTQLPLRSPPTPSHPRLEFGNLPSLWYTKRALPSFEIQLLDSNNRRIPAGSAWKLSLRLIALDDTSLDHLLISKSTIFPFTDGRVVVSGVKFASVSSKNGGDFRLQAVVTACADPAVTVVLPATSPPIRVISERLFTETKAASVAELTPASKIIHIPGIGKKYSQRLAKAGLHTVADLAAFPADRLKELIGSLRQSRGTITEERLEELIQQCQAVVTASQQLQAPSPVSSTPQSDGVWEAPDTPFSVSPPTPCPALLPLDKTIPQSPFEFDKPDLPPTLFQAPLSDYDYEPAAKRVRLTDVDCFLNSELLS